MPPRRALVWLIDAGCSAVHQQTQQPWMLPQCRASALLSPARRFSPVAFASRPVLSISHSSDARQGARTASCSLTEVARHMPLLRPLDPRTGSVARWRCGWGMPGRGVGRISI